MTIIESTLPRPHISHFGKATLTLTDSGDGQILGTFLFVPPLSATEEPTPAQLVLVQLLNALKAEDIEPCLAPPESSEDTSEPEEKEGAS